SSLIAAWDMLRQAPASDPAEDEQFQEALRRAQADGGDRREDERRAQLRAQALLEANRSADAADAYDQALLELPQWALGHYNLALVYARLQRYSDAIIEMRRYLYLAPNAEDARAAQDQIYGWEALVTPQSTPAP